MAHDEQGIGTQWSAHAKVRQGGTRSNFDNYYPDIADAMRMQGMQEIKHLTDRVQELAKVPAIQEEFGIKPTGSTINTIISKKSKGSAKLVFSPNGDGFTKTAHLVAMALEKTPEELFGGVYQAPNTLSYEEHSAGLGAIAHDRGESDLSNLGLGNIIERFLENHDNISDRQKDVIDRLYGLSGPSQSKEEVGADLGISPEMVRMVEARILRQLRHPRYTEELRPFYNEPESSQGDVVVYNPSPTNE